MPTNHQMSGEVSVAVSSALGSQPDPISGIDRAQTLALEVKNRIDPALDESLQNELAKLLDLLPELRTSDHASLVPLAEIAAKALLIENPNIALAKGIRENLERRIKPPALSIMFRGFTGGTPTNRVILGLACMLYFAIPLVGLYGGRLLGQDKVLGFDASLLILVAIAGSLGSIVSIMVRIQDFARSKETDPSILFFTGFFKPVIGMSFALFVFAVLNAGILPLTIQEEKARYFFAALAFVSGFSERFATDVASRTEKVVDSTSSLQ